MGIITKELDEQGLWPNKNQIYLLKASLLDGDDALNNWKLWRDSFNFEDDFDYYSFRLIPLLYHNLNKLGVQDKLMARMKGVYRLAWYNNHRLFHQMMPVLTEMREEGLDVLGLKGLVMVHRYYQHHALRPMSDVDLMVPFHQVKQTLNFFTKRDWVPDQGSRSIDDLIKYRHSLGFVNSDKVEVDIHWHLMLECCNSAYDEIFWSGSIEIEIDGLKVKSLNPTDILLHTIIHGLRWNPEPPIRWIPDAVTILRIDGDKINWQQLCDNAKSIGVSSRLVLGLNFINKHFNCQVPDFVIERLEKEKITFLEKIENSYVLSNKTSFHGSIKGRILTMLAEYQCVTKTKSHMPSVSGLPRYIMYREDLKSYGELFKLLLKIVFKSVKKSVFNRI